MAGYPYKVSGHGDLSGIFKAYVSGTHPSNTGYKVSGVDLATLFQSSNYQGFDQISYNTNYKSLSLIHI